MKKILMFFAGLVLLCLTVGMVLVSGVLYDTVPQRTTDTFFFQTADLADQRIGTPRSHLDTSDEEMRRLLIDKFITEYFYIIPDMNNVSKRLDGDVKSGLYPMVVPTVFNQWKTTMGKTISDLAAQGVMRFARVIDIQPEESGKDWWAVTYELTTWNAPNDLSSTPATARDVMYVNFRYEPGIRPNLRNEKFDISEFLESGGDPSVVFKFIVNDIE